MKTLRDYKKKSKLSNNEIAKRLNQPRTLVEHWFRTDNCFAIPNKEIWLDLKYLLEIDIDIFDESIMTFEERDGLYDKSNRAYSIEGIAPTLTSVSAENERIILKDKKGENMWNNKLKKYNFNMEEIKIFDIFSGIGALHKSLKSLGVPTKLTNISEIDVDATISYAGIHIDNFKDLEFEYPSDEYMKEWLISRNIGYSYEKDKSSIPRMKREKLKLAYKASYLLNNLGDIAKIDYDSIEDFDLMNFSFSCTDLSHSGKQRGMKNEDGTPTRSGLYIYGIKAIRSKKPKYIMIENVKGLISNKFIDDFYSIINELDEIGYSCYYPKKKGKNGELVPTCLNAKDFGIPQNRERIFVICVRKDIDDNNFEFPIGQDKGFRLKDVLEDNVEEKYYLSEEIQNRFKLNDNKDINRNEINTVGTSAPSFRTIGQRDLTYGVNGIMSTLSATDYKQPKQITIDNPSYLIRKLTPLETYRLMGFEDCDFYKAKELGIADSSLYKQAGNSIVVNVLYEIFKNLFKKYII